MWQAASPSWSARLMAARLPLQWPVPAQLCCAADGAVRRRVPSVAHALPPLPLEVRVQLAHEQLPQPPLGCAPHVARRALHVALHVAPCCALHVACQLLHLDVRAAAACARRQVRRPARGTEQRASEDGGEKAGGREDEAAEGLVREQVHESEKRLR
jgi:hypothetical protein